MSDILLLNSLMQNVIMVDLTIPNYKFPGLITCHLIVR